MRRAIVMTVTLTLALILAGCSSLEDLLGGSEESSGEKGPQIAADRRAPADQYGAAMLETLRYLIAKGDFVEAHYLVNELEAVKLPDAQQKSLAELGSQVQKGYPTVRSSLYNSGALTPAKDFTGKYGYIDEAGKFVIPARFFKADAFSEGMALVEEQKGKQSFIDSTGKMIFEVTPAVEHYFYDPQKRTLWLVPHDGEGALVQYDGSFPIPLDKIRIEALGGFHSGLARCDVTTYQIQLKDGSYTQPRNGTIYIDTTGKEKLFFPDGMWWFSKSEYECEDFSEGRAVVREESEGEDLRGYIDPTGKWVIEPTFRTAGRFHDGMAPVIYPNTDKWGFIDATGAVAIRPFYKVDTIQFFNDGAFICRDEVNKKIMVLNKTGSIISEFSWQRSSSDIIDNMIAYASHSGDGIIHLGWTKGTPGIADDLVTDSLVGLDRTGKEMFAVCSVGGREFDVDTVWGFSNARAFVCTSRQGDVWGIIDTRGNWIAQPKRAWIPQSNFQNGLAQVKLVDTGAIAYLDRSGRIVYQE